MVGRTASGRGTALPGWRVEASAGGSGASFRVADSASLVKSNLGFLYTGGVSMETAFDANEIEPASMCNCISTRCKQKSRKVKKKSLVLSQEKLGDEVPLITV